MKSIHEFMRDSLTGVVEAKDALNKGQVLAIPAPENRPISKAFSLVDSKFARLEKNLITIFAERKKASKPEKEKSLAASPKVNFPAYSPNASLLGLGLMAGAGILAATSAGISVLVEKTGTYLGTWFDSVKDTSSKLYKDATDAASKLYESVKDAAYKGYQASISTLSKLFDSAITGVKSLYDNSALVITSLSSKIGAGFNSIVNGVTVLKDKVLALSFDVDGRQDNLPNPNNIITSFVDNLAKATDKWSESVFKHVTNMLASARERVKQNNDAGSSTPSATPSTPAAPSTSAPRTSSPSPSPNAPSPSVASPNAAKPNPAPQPNATQPNTNAAPQAKPDMSGNFGLSGINPQSQPKNEVPRNTAANPRAMQNRQRASSASPPELPRSPAPSSSPSSVSPNAAPRASSPSVTPNAIPSSNSPFGSLRPPASAPQVQLSFNRMLVSSPQAQAPFNRMPASNMTSNAEQPNQAEPAQSKQPNASIQPRAPTITPSVPNNIHQQQQRSWMFDSGIIANTKPNSLQDATPKVEAEKPPASPFGTLPNSFSSPKPEQDTSTVLKAIPSTDAPVSPAPLPESPKPEQRSEMQPPVDSSQYYASVDSVPDYNQPSYQHLSTDPGLFIVDINQYA